jgi:hypothetical protein
MRRGLGLETQNVRSISIEMSPEAKIVVIEKINKKERR